MLSRFVVAFIIVFSSAITAAASPLSPLNDPALLDSVKEFCGKNYPGAVELAMKAPESPAKNFILGMSYYRLENFGAAAESFAKSADVFPLLGDYALYYRADALIRLGRYDDAGMTLAKLENAYPASPLRRDASLLRADALFQNKDYSNALTAYRKYVETYPSGTSSIRASYQAALCSEEMGNVNEAAKQMRMIWLKYPASQVASLAQTALQRLKAENVAIPPYSAEEMFDRGVILYDLGKYAKSLDIFTSLSQNALPRDFMDRVELKIGQALFKSRHYKDAARTLELPAAGKDPETACEAAYWLARSLYRSGNTQQSLDLFTKITDTSPQCALADDALFFAAMIRKYAGKNDEAVSMLDKLVAGYPSSPLKPKALWECAWMRYLAKDYKNAAEYLDKLLNNPSYREKSLYWLGRSEQSSGNISQATSTFGTLVSEYPHGFYTLRYLNPSGAEDAGLPSSKVDIVSTLPIPSGYDRIKTLIALGLDKEAGMELSYCRKKASSRNKVNDIARLYWEMNDYRSAMRLYKKAGGNNALSWNFSYPPGFSKHVSSCAEDFGIPESLAYSIIRTESSFSPSVRSGAGAVGLMQVMPATAGAIYKKKSAKLDSTLLTQPGLNINLGMKHFKYLVGRFNGSLFLAVAAYNSGETPVDRWLRNFPQLREDEFIENIPYPETREYVKKVLTGMVIYKSLYGLDEEPSKTETAGRQAPMHPAADVSLSSDPVNGAASAN